MSLASLGDRTSGLSVGLGLMLAAGLSLLFWIALVILALRLVG